MTKHTNSGIWLPIASIGVFLGVILAFLVVRTQTNNSSSYFQSIAIMRQLQQVDARWELDVVKSKIGINVNYDPFVDPVADLNQLQALLLASVQGKRGHANTDLARSIDAFAATVQEKTRLIELFKSHNAVLQNSETFLPTAADDLQEAMGPIQQRNSAGPMGNLSRKVNSILLGVLVYNQTASNEKATVIRTELEALSASDFALPRGVRDRLEIFKAHALTVSREQLVVNDLLRSVAGVPTTSRISDIDRLLTRNQKIIEQQTLRDRQFLLIFSAALIILLLYSGVRLIKGHALVNRANKQLNETNCSLEDRVGERTSELMIANSELRKRETQLASQAQQLEQARDVAEAANDAKSAFLATMSHELRTPLNAILGFTQLMQSELFGPIGHPKYAEYVNDVNKSGSHLLALINDILDLSRLDAGKAELVEEQFSLGSLISDVCRSLEPLARHGGLEILTSLSPLLPGLRADQRRIKQVVLNLVSNAIKFTPSGGTITVGASEVAGELVIKFSDTGIGISKVDLPKALERFGQIDNSHSRKYAGTGLGLPLTKQLVEIHDGRFEIQSDLGVGTTITITLPSERVVGLIQPPRADIISIRSRRTGNRAVVL